MESKLPDNWVETDIKTISTIVRGVTYKKDQASAIQLDTSLYILRGGNIQDGKIDFDTNDNVYVPNILVQEIQKVKKNDVVIVGSTGSKKLIGKAGIAEEDLENVSFGAFLMLLRTKLINEKFHSYFFKTHYYRSSISALAGGVNINNIRKEHLENLIFPLPPLAEQERIVAKLDALFAQQEVMKKALSHIPALLKHFRQQVLTQAVTGKLTESWRDGKDLEEWKEKKLSDISSSKLGKMLDGVKNTGELVNYVGNVNVRWFNINFSNMKKLKIEPNDITKYTLLKGDVLVCEGGEPGRAAIWKYERNDVIFQKALHRIRLHKNVLPEFFLYNLKVDSLNNKLTQLFTGTTIKHLTGRSFSTYRVNIPSVQEQQEIVSRVESLFTKADDIEKRYKNLKEKIDQLPQALLHKAFKGELVEQLSTDGDAKDLLKEILALKNESMGKKKVVRNYKQNDEVLGKVAEGNN